MPRAPVILCTYVFVMTIGFVNHMLHLMCNCYWYTYINVHVLFHMYICYNCYVIQRRLHKLVKLVSGPVFLYEQIESL